MIELLLLLGTIGTGPVVADAGTVLHVDPDSVVSGDGTTWLQAFHHLQDALAAAALGGVSEIRVAEGTYRPDRSDENPEGTGDRDATFALLTGVGVRGGYAGYLEENPDDRDPELYPTVLSGDLLGDDGPDFTSTDDNSEHVVTATGVDASGVLDGFTVSGGNATSSGGGLVIDGGGPTIVACTFTANQAGLHGGGVECAVAATPSIAQCRFEGNRADSAGGGLQAGPGSDPAVAGCTFVGNDAKSGAGLTARGGTVTDCTFESNTARLVAGGLHARGTMTVRGCVFRANHAGVDGAGLTTLGEITVRDCSFTGNEAMERGGGMLADGDETVVDACTFDDNRARWGGALAIEVGFRDEVTVTGTTFTGNRAIADGGGVFLDQDDTVTLDGCTFDGNTAGAYGGGVFGRVGADVLATSCVFRGNATDLRGGGLAVRSESTAVLAGCLFDDNAAVEGGGAYIEESELEAEGCTFRGNRASKGGAVSMPDSVAAIRHSAFDGNTAQSFGGAIADEGLRELSFCVFTGNTAGAFGGTLYLYGSGPDVVNCVFSGNEAGNSGGGLRTFFGEPFVVNCTFSANEAMFGGAVSNASGAFAVANSVLWGNAGGAIDDDGSMTVRYSTVEGGAEGAGNLDADPLFVDADGADGVPGTADDDLRLRPGSPCIDAGDNAAVPAGVTLDLDGAARFQDDPDTPDTGRGTPPIVDMGPYEFTSCPADLDGSGAVDFGDIVAVLAAWGPCEGCPEDLDGSDVVDFGDVLVVLADWGACP